MLQAGPVAIVVDASEWHSYAGGIFNGCNQENPDLNHGVVLVGYGEEEGTAACHDCRARALCLLRALLVQVKSTGWCATPGRPHTESWATFAWRALTRTTSCADWM